MQTGNLSLSWGRHIEESVRGDAGTSRGPLVVAAMVSQAGCLSLNRTRRTQQLHAGTYVQSPLPEES